MNIIKALRNWAPSVSNIVIPYGIDNKILKTKKKKSSNLLKRFLLQSTKRFRLVTGELKSTIYPNVKNAKLNLFTGVSTYGEFGKNIH